MKNICRSVLFALVVAMSLGSVCQTRSDTPAIIEVIGEEGPATSNSGLEAVLLRMRSQKDSAGLRWLAGPVVAGELNHTVAIIELSNYVALEQSNRALHSAWASLPAEARPKLHGQVFAFAPKQSYNDGHVLWKDAQGFGLYSVRLTTGGTDEYVEQQRIATEYLAKAKVQDEEWLGFAASYAEEVPAFIFITPLRSLSELDNSTPHGDVLPPDVDRARNVVLLKAVQSSSHSLMLVRKDLSSITR